MTEERIVGSEDVYDGRVVHLRVDTIRRADGQTYRREVIRHGGAVAMVALDEDGQVFLVRQYRAGAERLLLEIPAGGLEPGEPPAACARRELQEEIGYYPEEMVELGGFWVAASYTSEYITLYLMRNLRPSRLEGDLDEDISVERVPFEQALQMALSNEIADSKTVIGLVWAARRLGKLTAG
jgi:ADP-ribose pyrophosphatase